MHQATGANTVEHGRVWIRPGPDQRVHHCRVVSFRRRVKWGRARWRRGAWIGTVVDQQLGRVR